MLQPVLDAKPVRCAQVKAHFGPEACLPHALWPE
jgi:hypothetical protein